MSLSIGIVGLPNVGKSTLFNALLKREAALAANYPFATIEPNIGVVEVPDDRLNKLADLIKFEYSSKSGGREVPEKIVPSIVKFYDIAGLVKGASSGEGLGNEFLGHIREVSAIVQVVRVFEDGGIIRSGSTDPKSDIETINAELIFADIPVVEKRLNKLRDQVKKTPNKDDADRITILEGWLNDLNNIRFPSVDSMSNHELDLVSDLHLLTTKPMIYALNVSEDQLGKNLASGYSLNGEVFEISAKLEYEMSGLTKEDREVFMQEYGITGSGLDLVIKAGYKALGLRSFLTAGPKEVRAWTFHDGYLAPQAAGVIHSDFERGFISAEIISYEDLISSGSFKAAKEKGLLRLEGKTYKMKDGDVVEFRFST